MCNTNMFDVNNNKEWQKYVVITIVTLYSLRPKINTPLKFKFYPII